MRERVDGLRVDPNLGQGQKKMRFNADSSCIKGKLTETCVSRESSVGKGLMEIAAPQDDFDRRAILA